MWLISIIHGGLVVLAALVTAIAPAAEPPAPVEQDRPPAEVRPAQEILAAHYLNRAFEVEVRP
jgi:hypothetical protein